jgi:hypothetical protein
VQKPKLLCRQRAVRLPPGRSRLTTRPTVTASPPVLKTIGIVVVAVLAARAAGPSNAAITATCLRASSAASAGRRWY